ncbi:hypothetical protein JM946_03975 [Steroidobacter sp. S1-65]|uniref:TIGR03067 domain-containing protein n=1 Tax=Steroidobacter gossypii TaxID=2805490 RepID=A0ABS1WSF6_9GAMM|nr:hypothetical protein [Steroidobacter gossypii]MBM0103883.1 hypothetical protein [Steroidobacter gossypii]
MQTRRAWIVTSVALLLGACVSTPPSQPQSKVADLSGEWVLTTESRMGKQDAHMTVRQTGSALAGTITSEAGIVDYTGSVKGAAVAFDFTLEMPGADLKLDYTGTVEGDTMKGKAVFGQFGEGSFIARRK